MVKISDDLGTDLPKVQQFVWIFENLAGEDTTTFKKIFQALHLEEKKMEKESENTLGSTDNVQSGRGSRIDVSNCSDFHEFISKCIDISNRDAPKTYEAFEKIKTFEEPEKFEKKRNVSITLQNSEFEGFTSN